MHYKHIIFLLFIIPVFYYSCKPDIIEINLNKEQVVILAPLNGYKTTILTHTFWWEEVKGASEYNLQIVSTSFSNIQALILDSNTNTNKYTYTLNPGIYEWRVRAMNGSSTTGFTTYSLSIDSTSDLSQQTTELDSPSNIYITNNTTNTFMWKTLYNAEDYNFQIANPSFNGNYTLILSVSLSADTITYTLNEGIYEWRVRAQNANSNSPYTTRSITIDITSPATPVLTEPISGDTISSFPFDFKWSRDASGFASVSDSLYLYPDSLVSAATFTGYFSDSTYSYTNTLLSGDYFWRVRSYDAAGNKSNYSNLEKFIVQ